MPDWALAFLSGLQRTAVSGLAAELRAGGLLTAVLAFALGALHALTPGHGKAALAAYFFGQEARIATGLRVTLAAAFLHVVMGFVAFLVLRFLLSQTPLMTSRGSPGFAVAGYGLILLAGLMMLIQSLRSAPAGLHPHALTVGIGLLPCPLTIMVLGFAWVQATALMVGVVLVSLAAGIAFTIGSIAVIAIMARRIFGQMLLHRISELERGARAVQGVAGALIVAIAGYSIWTA
jgi:ABC-type nickel/cobalt efflux system permease component RcnA